MQAYEYAILLKGDEGGKQKSRLVTGSPRLVLAKDEKHARVLAARDEAVKDDDVERLEILVRPF